jgi:hypothetical protein
MQSFLLFEDRHSLLETIGITGLGGGTGQRRKKEYVAVPVLFDNHILKNSKQCIMEEQGPQKFNQVDTI